MFIVRLFIFQLNLFVDCQLLLYSLTIAYLVCSVCMIRCVVHVDMRLRVYNDCVRDEDFQIVPMSCETCVYKLCDNDDCRFLLTTCAHIRQQWWCSHPLRLCDIWDTCLQVVVSTCKHEMMLSRTIEERSLGRASCWVCRTLRWIMCTMSDSCLWA